jgi:hypothetical protein
MTTFFWVSYGLLWLLVVTLVVAVFALYYHFGQMYLNSREGRAEQGPSEGTLLDAFDGVDIEGRPVVLPRLRQPMLMVFTDTSCKLCGQLRQALARFADEGPSTVALYIICAGHPRSVREWAADLPGDRLRVIADPRGRTALSYRVDATPFCVAVDETGTVRASGIVNDLGGLDLAAREATALPVVLDGDHSTTQREG